MGFTAAVAAAGLAASLAVAGAPTSASAVTIPDNGVLYHRLVRICDRVPQLIARGDRVQPILGADANTPGSLRFLAARVARAKQDDQPRLEQRLQRRLDRRTQLAKRLPQLLTELKQAQQECSSSGLTSSDSGAGSGSSTGTPSTGTTS